MDTTDRSGISYWNEVRRKLIHLSSLWMPLAMCFLPRLWLCIAFGIMFLLNLLVEHAYASGVPWLMRLYDRFFGGMLRHNPQPGQWVISGGPYVFASACLSLALFPGKIAACCMAVMLLGDTAAALIGRRFGRHRVSRRRLYRLRAFSPDLRHAVRFLFLGNGQRLSRGGGGTFRETASY